MADTPVNSTSGAAPQSAVVNLVDPQGQLVGVPADQHEQALSEGYTQPTDAHIEAYKRQQAQNTPGQTLLAGLRGAGRAATFGALDLLQTSTGLATPQELKENQEAHPVASTVGEMAGLAGTALTGVGEGAVLEHAGKALGQATTEAITKGVAQSATEQMVAKIGSAAVRSAAENMLYQSGSELSKAIIDPNQSVESAVTDIGLSGLVGGAIGAGLGSISPLWHAAGGTKTGEILKAITEHVGGVEGEPSAIEQAIHSANIEVDPIIKAGMEGSPAVRQMAQILNDSATHSGLEAQQALENFHEQAGVAAADAFGKTVDEIPQRHEVSAYEAGKNIANTLADEADEKIGPEVKDYESYRERYKNVPFKPSISDKVDEITDQQQKLANKLAKATKEAIDHQKAGRVEAAIEAAGKVEDLRNEIKDLQGQAKSFGTVDQLVDKVSKLADKERWVISPSSEEMGAVRTVLKELPGLKTLQDLTDYIKRVGSNTASDLPFGQQTPLSRAGQKIIGVLRDAESDLIGNHVGSEEGALALDKYRSTRAAFREKAQLINALNDRLSTGSSVSGFGKAVRGMGKEEGEKVFRRLSGKGDADLLNLLQQHYPRTAQALREAHVESLLSGAKSSEGKLNASKLLKLFESTQLSPELRSFIANPQTQGKLDAIKTLIKAIPEKVGRSGTPQGLDGLMGHLPGTAMGLMSFLTGHSAGASLLVGKLTGFIGRDAPDAVRLGLLKFLGSNKQIDAPAFKTAVDFIHSAIRGENMTGRAASAVFKSGKEVLPASMMPTDEDRKKLDGYLKKVQEQPQTMMHAGEQVSHYMENHGQAVAQTTSQAVGYLNSIKPQETKSSPLDSKPVVSSIQKAQYNRALDIAEQPLVLLHHLKQGTLTPTDIQACQSMYPSFYKNIQQKLTSEMIDHLDKGHAVPYKTRIGLSMVLGQGLDSTLTPQGIMAAQPTPSAPQQQQNAAPPKKTTTALNKLSKSYQTPGQAGEEDATRKA